jgi:hypothetical protein
VAAAPELIPEGVTVSEALGPLGQVAAFGFVVGCIYVIDAFVRALFGTVSGVTGWIPYLNKVTAAPIHSIEQKVTSALGSAEHYFDNRIGVSLHKLARIGDHIGRELYGLALASLTIAKIMAGSVQPGDLARIWHYLTGAWKTAAHQASVALHKIESLAHITAKSVNVNALPRLRTVERTIDRTLKPEIKTLRDQVKALEDGAVGTFKWIRAHPLSATTAAFTAAVAVAIGRLGMGWTRCSNWNKIGKTVCGVNSSEIDALLGLLVGVAALEDYQQLVKLMQGVEKVTAEGIQTILKA